MSGSPAASLSTFLMRPFAGITPERRKLYGLLLLGLVLLVLPQLTDDDSNIDSMANAMSYVALSLGLNVVVGFAGLLDLGYAAFFAIGAYFYGIFTAFQVMPLWSAGWEPLAVLGPGAEAETRADPTWCISRSASGWRCRWRPSWRRSSASCSARRRCGLRGDYLAIVTLGFGEIVPIVARNVDSVTNGAAGLNGIRAPRLFGHSFGIDATPYYYVGLVLVAFLIFCSIRLRDSRVGRAWMAIREDRDGSRRDGRGSRAVQAARVRHRCGVRRP